MFLHSSIFASNFRHDWFFSYHAQICMILLSWNNICGDILLTFSFHDMMTANIVKLKKYFSIFHFLSKFYTKFPHCMIWLHDKANFSQQLYFLYLSSTVLYLQSFFLHSLHLARFLLLPTTTSGLKTSILTTWDRPETRMCICHYPLLDCSCSCNWGWFHEQQWLGAKHVLIQMAAHGVKWIFCWINQ